MAINKEILKEAKTLIGAFIDKTRTDKNLSVSELCKNLSINRVQYYSIKNGEKSYTTGLFLYVLQELQIDLFFKPRNNHLDLIDLIIKSQSKKDVQKYQKEIGTFFDKARLKQNISINKICEKAGITRDQFNNFKNAKNNYTIDLLLIITKELNFLFFMETKE
jgi:transcriptional regulator with XRE-family HTH domain